MKLRFCVLSLLLITFSCSSLVKKDPNGIQTNSSTAQKAPYVVMISLDGFRHDYIKKYNPLFLGSIVNEGIQAKRLTPVFPSKTFPNHYSLITGLYAGNHQLVANRFYDPELKESYQLGNSKVTRDGKWYGGSPLWLSVREQGMLSASFFWVGSDANIKGLYPNYYVPYDGKVKNRTRVEQVLKWLKLPEKERPHFITLYFSDVDSAGHRHTPDSIEVNDAVQRVDQEIAYLYKEASKLNLPINFVIVSDHGMKAVENKKKVYLKKYIDITKAQFKEKGPITFIYLKDRKDIASYKRKLQKVPYTKVYLRSELPKKFHLKQSARAGDIILLAEPGAYIYPLKDPKKNSPMEDKYSGGTHGYDPYKSKEMGGIFLALGPNVKKAGMVPVFDNIHVYPFVMKLLGLPVKNKIDGKLSVLKRYFRKSADNP